MTHTTKFGLLLMSLVLPWGHVCEAAMPKAVQMAYHKDNCLKNESARSCAWLGATFEKKGKRDKARPYYKKACHALIHPLAPACYLWGLLEKGPKARRAAFARACRLHDPDGCTAMGEWMMRKKKPSLALPYYKKACARKDGRGCHRLARHWFRKGKLARSMNFLRRSCKLGYTPGCGSLGWLYESKTKQLAKAKKAYWVGCQMRGAAVCARLGLLLRKLKKRKQAKAAFRKACRYGYKKACAWVK